MSKFTHVLLDLDGTITNPQEGITKSVAFALDHFSIPYASLESLNSFIGPPLDISFREYGLKEEEIEIAIAKFREFYAKEGIFQCFLYDGLVDLLKTLKDNDKIIYLATSKVRDFAYKILEHFKIEQYFDFVAGSEFDGSRTNKADVIAFALEQTNTKITDKIIMVGDRKHDIIGAKKNNIKVAGILYGYGSREELESENPDYLIDNMHDLKLFLIQN